MRFLRECEPQLAYIGADLNGTVEQNWVPNALSMVQAIIGPLVVSNMTLPTTHPKVLTVFVLAVVLRFRHLSSSQNSSPGDLRSLVCWSGRRSQCQGHLRTYRRDHSYWDGLCISSIGILYSL